MPKEVKQDVIQEILDHGYNLDNVPDKDEYTLAQLQAMRDEYRKDGVPHVITEEDIKANPDIDLGEEGLKVGDEIRLPWADAETEAEPDKGNVGGEVETPKDNVGKTDTSNQSPAAEENGDGPVEVTVLGNVEHNGETYRAGDTLQCRSSEADGLVEAGMAERKESK